MTALLSVSLSSCSKSDDDGGEIVQYDSGNFDFSAKNSDGAIIYYNFYKEDEAEVTYALKVWDIEFQEYQHLGYEKQRRIRIPSTVTTNGKTLKVTRIGEEAFAIINSGELESITIPVSVTSIGKDALGFVPKIIIPDITAWCNITYEGTCGGTLYSDENTEVTNLVIPSGITSISGSAFGICPNVTSVSLPNTLISIGEYAFAGKKISSITLPESVKYIGKHAFESIHLVTVTSLSKEPIPYKNMGIEVFHKNTLNNGILYVPVGSISKYKAEYPWQQFATIKEKAGNE